MKINKTILIIDDEPDIRELLVITLSRMGFETACAEDYNSAIHMLDNNQYDCCLTDMRLPDGDGLDIVQHIQQLNYTLPVAVISAHGNMELAIKALKTGAFDFVSKPISLELLRNLVSKAIESTNQLSNPNNKSPDKENNYQIIGNSPSITELNKTITKLATTQVPVYIQGESGTGKELVAQQIHKQSARSNAPFIAVNCGAIPSELMESEFFGHKKGSFTGASSDQDGLFQTANGGTLFLDEIADLPLHMQVKLLRVLQEKKIRPIGSAQEKIIDVRIISASYKELAELVKDGLFRQDLFYRINVIQILVPSLKDRISDIDLLIPYILGKINGQNNSSISINQQAIIRLKQYPFPGNVRELENILERASALCDDYSITEHNLNLPAQYNSTQTVDLTTQTQNIEIEHIKQSLESNQWNQSATARQLHITLRQLRYRMEKFGLK